MTSKPIFVHHTPHTLIAFKDYHYLEYEELKADKFTSNLNFIVKLNPVVIKNYPPLLWGNIKNKEFDNEVVILSENKSRMGYVIKHIGSQNTTIKEPCVKNPSKIIANWYYYWKIKGILSLNIEPLLHKVTGISQQ